MISITFITAIVFIFLLLPYFTTITFLRWKGVAIRYSNSAAFGLETICFLPVIVVSHLATNLVSWGFNLYNPQVFAKTSYRTFIRATFDSGFKPNWSRLPEWLWYLGLFSIVHICLSVILYVIIKKQITWSISKREGLWRICCLKWMRSFGVWNDFSEDISYCSIYDIRPIHMDLCLADSGETLYRGVLKDYSDIGGFKGIVLTNVQVKRIYFRRGFISIAIEMRQTLSASKCYLNTHTRKKVQITTFWAKSSSLMTRSIHCITEFTMTQIR